MGEPVISAFSYILVAGIVVALMLLGSLWVDEIKTPPRRSPRSWDWDAEEIDALWGDYIDARGRDIEDGKAKKR